MTIHQDFSLLEHNSFGIAVKADYFAEYDSIEKLRTILQSKIVSENRLLHIGAGSNLLFLNDFHGVVLHSAIKTIRKVSEDADSVLLEVGAAVVWDDLVEYAVANAWGGIENLSLIPGEVGAAAVQNIGAYGVEMQDVVISVEAMNVSSLEVERFKQEDCHYAYRESIFKGALKGKVIITAVVIRLSKAPQFKLNYQGLEASVKENGEINLHNIRQTIIAIRESKLPDPKKVGNAGSFFMNPVIGTAQFKALQADYPTLPHYFISETEEKIPAAWLIDQCGWKGKQIGNAGVHDKQALVLVNRGGATGSEMVALAEKIQASVQEKFGIGLQAEVNYIS